MDDMIQQLGYAPTNHGQTPKNVQSAMLGMPPQRKGKRKLTNTNSADVSIPMLYAQLLARSRGRMMPNGGIPRRDGLLGLMDALAARRNNDV